ncbi:MAG: hypothetical protein LBR07_01780 [Puniceicoccales bacterium]|jgi:ubiquinone biosynthesis protein|nr:hypothetical protein [Puniceicoccales bacterium]
MPIPRASTEQSAPARALSLVKNVARAREIFTVIIKNGFLEFLEQVEAPSSFLAKIIPIRVERRTRWQRIRDICEQLGPTFVKIAQVAGTRDDLLPAPLVAEFRELRDRVAPLPWKAMRPVLEEELRGGDAGGLHGHFSEFDEKPVACGSLGQVYRARLAADGAPVAVKIQRPGVRRAMRADFEILAWLAARAHERFPELRAYNLPVVVAETAAGVLQEIDFSIEARNAAHFNAENPFRDVFAPRVYERLSTHRLLVSEWVEGLPPGDPRIPRETAARLAAAGARSVFRQIFLDGFFHADPHTGNLLVTADGRLCMLDWGLAGSLTRRMRYLLADLFSALASQDAEKVLQALLARGVRRRVDRSRLETDIAFVLRRHSNLAREPGEFGRAMLELLRVFGQHGITFARDYTLLAKAVLAIEDSGRRLDPGFDLQAHARHFLGKLRMERWSPRTLLRLGWWGFASNAAQLRDMPGNAGRILEKLEAGELGLNVEHVGMGEFRHTIEVSVNRLVLAVIIAALLIGSSLLARGEADLWRFPPSPGVVGYVLAFTFTLLIIWDILWHGRHK